MRGSGKAAAGVLWAVRELRVGLGNSAKYLASHLAVPGYFLDVATIEITGKAEEELVRLLKSKAAAATAGLRLAVRKGGCAGWQYEMNIAEPEAGDEVVERGAARVIVAGDSLEKLRGCEIDFSDDLTDAGFKISNPKARRACGCGTSFEPEDEPEGSGAADGEVCGSGGAE